MPRQVINAIKLYPGLDCMNIRDFSQYYRGHYFGIQYPDSRELCPAWLGTGWTNENAIIAHPKDAVPIWIYRDGQQRQFIMTLEDLRDVGRFGTPALGNACLGPSYAYYMGYPMRDSAKGFNLAKPGVYSPNSDSLLHKYPKKFPELRSRMGTDFGTNQEMVVVHQIYNPTYYNFEEAIEELNQGNRLGTPLNRTTGLFLEEGSTDISVSHKDMTHVGKVIRGGISLKRKFGFLASSLQQSLQNLDIQVE